MSTSALVRLNIGSGGDAVPGWVNVDKSPALLLAKCPPLRALASASGLLSAQQRAGFSPDIVYGDASKRLRFADRSVDSIYSSHMIEHLSRSQGLVFLREAARVLKPGGIIRLATPDLEALVEEYRARPHQPGADHLMTRMHFLHDDGEGPIRRFISRNLSGHWHQWLYDGDSLVGLLEQAGFQDAHVMAFQEGALPDLASIELRPESLFVEAKAPGR